MLLPDNCCNRVYRSTPPRVTRTAALAIACSSRGFTARPLHVNHSFGYNLIELVASLQVTMGDWCHSYETKQSVC